MSCYCRNLSKRKLILNNYYQQEDLCNPIRTSLISNTKFLNMDNKDYESSDYSLFPVYPNSENDYVIVTNTNSFYPKQIQNYFGKTFQVIQNDPAIEKTPNIKLKDVSTEQIKNKLDKLKNKTYQSNNFCRSCSM